MNPDPPKRMAERVEVLTEPSLGSDTSVRLAERSEAERRALDQLPVAAARKAAYPGFCDQSYLSIPKKFSFVLASVPLSWKL